jgi:hypothetical protein
MTMFARLFTAGLVGLAVVTAAATADAGQRHKKKQAGGHASSTATARTNLALGHVLFDSTSDAFTRVDLLAGGQYIDATADAGNRTTYKGVGKTELHQNRDSKAKIYAKGGNVMAKARSAAHTTIKAGGHTYVVANEVARAMTRFTPLGTTALAASETSVSVVNTGYVGMSSSTSDKAHVRIKVQ